MVSIKIWLEKYVKVWKKVSCNKINVTYIVNVISVFNQFLEKKEWNTGSLYLRKCRYRREIRKKVFLMLFGILIAALATIVAAISLNPKTLSNIEVSNYGKYLEELYQMRSTDAEKRPYLHSVHFIDLVAVSITHYAESPQESTQPYDPDKIKREKKSIDINDLFKPTSEKKMKLILVEGAPGIGKSALAMEIASRWKKRTNYELALLVPLKEYHARTIDDLLYDNPSINMVSIKHYINNTQGEKLLWILDGFDELSDLQKNNPNLLIYQLLDGRLLSKCTVLITTRPSASQYLFKYLNPNTSRHFEIIGFSSENIFKFIKRNVFIDQPHLLTSFFEYCSNFPIIEGLMHIPLNAVIIALTYEENYQGRPFSQTMTELYNSFICALLRRYLTSGASKVPDRLTTTNDIAKLPKNIQNSFNNLLELAYNRSRNKKRVLNFGDGEFETLGFMTTKFSRISAARTEFLHKTLQDFLAAIYLTINPAKPYPKSVSDNMVMFLFGIGSMNSVKQRPPLDLILKATHPVVLLVRCFFENTEAFSMFTSIKKPLYSSQPSDYYKAGHLIANFGLSLTIAFYCEDTANLKMFQKGLDSKTASVAIKKGRIGTLIVVCNVDEISTAEEYLVKIYEAPVTKRKLVLAGQHSIGLIKSVRPSVFKTLKISPRSSSPIIQSRKLTNITSKLIWTEEALNDFKKLLLKTSALIQITVYRPTNSEKSSQLLKILFLPTSLEMLRIKQFDFRAVSKDVIQLIKSNDNINKLEMINCRLSWFFVTSLLLNHRITVLEIKNLIFRKSDIDHLDKLVRYGSFEIVKVLLCKNFNHFEAEKLAFLAEKNLYLKKIYLIPRKHSSFQFQITKVHFEEWKECEAH